MKEWSLGRVFAGLHDEIERRLMIVRRTIGHPNTMGSASDAVWLDLLGTYLPRRYQAATAHVADSTGAFSQQIDVVVFDRQYSPFILHYQGQTILPVESVYAVLETKQVMNAKHFAYAQEKTASVRRLEPADPPCRGHLSGEGAGADSRRHPDLRKRLEPALRPAVPRGR